MLMMAISPNPFTKKLKILIICDMINRKFYVSINIALVFCKLEKKWGQLTRFTHV